MHTYTYTHTLWVLSPLPPAKDLFFFHLFTPPVIWNIRKKFLIYFKSLTYYDKNLSNQKKRLLRRLDKYINHISVIKKDIRTFLQKRDDLCDEIMKLFEYHVERKRFQKLVTQLES